MLSKQHAPVTSVTQSSWTVTWNVHSRVSFEAFTAWQSTVVFPMGNRLPLGGVQLITQVESQCATGTGST